MFIFIGWSNAKYSCFFFRCQGPNSDITFEIVGDSVAMDLFAIDAERGVVTLRESLVDRVEDEYTVGVK